MKVSIIIAVYKDVQALKLVIETLRYQTYQNFEVIIVEDGENPDMQQYIQTITDLKVKHTTQIDKGVRKARSQNNGILAATSEYLIFIDGDCLLYSTFIEGHVALAEKGYALSGRRINLNKDLTKKLRNHNLNPKNIEDNIFTKYLYLSFDRDVRFEQGITLNPKGFFYNNFVAKRDRNTAILGCNFSCWKKDFLFLNGFDENYGETAIPDDMDWDWRFKAYGIKIKSCKNIANMMHLHHKAHDRGDPSEELAKMSNNQKENLFICKQGLNTH